MTKSSMWLYIHCTHGLWSRKVIPLVSWLRPADQYVLCEFNCAMMTVSDVLWIQAVSYLSGGACYSRISIWPEAKLSRRQENSYFITVYNLCRGDGKNLQYNIAQGGGGGGWDEMVVHVGSDSKEKWMRVEVVTGADWSLGANFLPANCQSSARCSGLDHSLHVKRARIKTVRDKDNGDTLPLFPWELPPTPTPPPRPHNDSVQWDDVFFWPTPDVSSRAAVQNFSALCAGLCHCGQRQC